MYAFPSGWRPYETGEAPAHPRLRFLEVLLEDGRVAHIDNNPSTRTSYPACSHPFKLLDDGQGEPPGFEDFQSFAGVKVGAPEGDLARRFGRAPNMNASRDWLSYLPVPLTFGADPDTGRITGFAIGTDDSSVTMEGEVVMNVELDSATCRPVSVRFGPDGAASQRRASR